MIKSTHQGATGTVYAATPRRIITTALLAGAAMAAIGPGQARAEAAATPPAVDAAATPPAGADIVVTAQRREQKLKDVGIAITVLDKETIHDLNITNATDVVRAGSR